MPPGGAGPYVTPGKGDMLFAERVVVAFAVSPGMGTIGLDGTTLDISHVKAVRLNLLLAGLD